MTGRALNVAVLAKQVPAGGSVQVGADGRVRRDGPAEINPYCRRAIAQGVALARQTQGRCTVLTMGPPRAADVLSEAIAWGADRGVLIGDPALAGADLQVTARALAAAVHREGHFDLVLVGHSSLDAETAQVGPLLAGLLGRPFAGAARTLRLVPDGLEAECEQDHQLVRALVRLPAVVAAAERLCAPAKAPGHPRADVTVRTLADLPGAMPAGASPTRVGRVVPAAPTRTPKILHGPVEQQAAQAVALLAESGALIPDPAPAASDGPHVAPRSPGPAVAVVADPHHGGTFPELLGLAARIGGEVQALCGPGPSAELLGRQGADLLLRLPGPVPGPAATALRLTTPRVPPSVVLVPATAWGREVAGRYAAATGAGLIADAVTVSCTGGEVVAEVCAFAGSGLAEVSSNVPAVVTVRPGVLPVPARRTAPAAREVTWDGPAAACDMTGCEVTELGRTTVDDWTALSRAEVVVGVGQGVDAADHAALRPLLDALGAQLAGTRKLTDSGVLPRSRQIGATGRSIRPRLYIAIGLSGRPHHMAGVTGAGTILAINPDPDAPVLAAADVGIVAEWQRAVPALVRALAEAPAVTAGRRRGHEG